MNEIARFNPEQTVSATSSLINRSQNRQGTNRTTGHARGHVSNPGGSSQCVENYSRNGWKTGFHERQAQNQIVHEFLKSPSGQREVAILNRGQKRRAIKKRIPSRIKVRAGEWSGGRCTRTYTPDEARLVIEHQLGKESESSASVQILTCFPEKWARPGTSGAASDSTSDGASDSDTCSTSSDETNTRSHEADSFRRYKCVCCQCD